MQTAGKAEAREAIAEDEMQKPTQLPTVRGTIYDSCGRELAVDKPQFYVQVNYQAVKYLHLGYRRAMTLKKVSKGMSIDDAKSYVQKKYDEQYAVVDKCLKLLGDNEDLLRKKIHKINNGIWELREYIAWKREFSQSKLYLKKKAEEREVRYSDAMKDFMTLLKERDIKSSPSARELNAKYERHKLALIVDIKESKDFHPIYKIPDREKLLEVQEQFTGIEGFKIAPMTKRVYHEKSESACHLIGWVGPAQTDENAMFPKDVYSIYNASDFSGKERGIEWAYEIILRGKRGEVTYSKREDEPVSRKPTQFGEDIQLSIDIELQHRIKHYLSDKTIFPDPNAEMGAVVIDVETGEILAMVSMPTYDLREIRKEKVYDAVGNGFKNKALYETYPPGSVIKPFFLVMGLETGKITANEIIHCTTSPPPSGWPGCMIRRFYNTHDNKWAGQGGNIARNAIRGSCNIYFSRLAHRMTSEVIQSWLYNFGFGRKTLMPAHYPGLLKELKRADSEAADRTLQEAGGIIYTAGYEHDITCIEDLPPLKSHEKRRFGIGQASMRVTVLQVANGMATLARGGTYKYPRLFIGDTENKKYRPVDLKISNSTMRVVRDGMHAVVYEKGGTAYNAFKDGKFKEKFGKRNITLYGKTGSTQSPYNAWFAGFAEDKSGRALAFAIVVVRGKSGSQHAAPKGLRILEICNEMGYIGDKPEKVATP